ncbi:cytochrome c [Methylomarinum sp. Ch1-1]|uniref:Cytochrome c n=1 Tax=Methylomarinum roseum TaxID=3067653 RepID=A0AAU7NPC6_9GAMM|nr:cytochrome c [Methylomarinum sp. Ch1-1]MDP4521295.1 cytochrome c [Methylomarinum sp. Ch1-1]
MALALSAHAWADEPSVQRQRELLHLLKHDCGSCHGLTLKGGLGPALLAGAIADKEDDFLIRTILHGRKGTAMPPWRDFISASEAAWLVEYLRQPPKID